jgi:hypothetical protein
MTLPEGSQWNRPPHPSGKEVGTIIEHHDDGTIMAWASTERYGEPAARRKVERVLIEWQKCGHDFAEGTVRTEGEFVVARSLCLTHQGKS